MVKEASALVSCAEGKSGLCSTDGYRDRSERVEGGVKDRATHEHGPYVVFVLAVRGEDGRGRGGEVFCNLPTKDVVGAGDGRDCGDGN